jgi:HSP20 family protein
MQGWWDIDRTLAEMEDFRRRMDDLFEAFDGSERDGSRQLGWTAYPDARITDEGNDIVLIADVPGFDQQNLDLQVTGSGVSLTGNREVDIPEGYVAHRRERRSIEFSRRFTLPVKVDPNSADAHLENGVLTLHLKKIAEAQPRRIAVSK